MKFANLSMAKVQAIVQSFVLLIIIGTASLLALAFLGSLVVVVSGALTNPHLNLDDKAIVIFDKAMQALTTAGMSCLTFLFGYLARGPQRSPDEPVQVSPVATQQNADHPPKVENVSTTAAEPLA